jgi:DNA-binding response OmpR family regulator
MSQKTVLLVEDEDNIALALSHLIGRAGFHLRREATGNAALAALREDKPDLVVLDVMLPELSGYEICEIIRRDPDLAGIKVLMITAGGGDVERRKGLAVGADAFMTKPFATADLTARITEMLREDGHD